MYEYIYDVLRQQIIIQTGLVEYHGLSIFQNIQVKTFKSSQQSYYFWVKLLKKEPYISLSAFDHFDGHLRGSC